MIERIISGGQTGADQGGLDAALQAGVPHGGFCPKNRRSEWGIIPAKYQLVEMASFDYPPRTRKNIESSDGTVVFTKGAAEAGSKLTIDLCRQYGKPVLWVNIAKTDIKGAVESICRWSAEHDIVTLNVAGNRESKSPGIQALVGQIIGAVLSSQLSSPGV